MPIHASNPFSDPLKKMRPEVNRYLSILQENAQSGRLPLLYGPALEGLAGQWRTHFATQMETPAEELVLEIGSHFGEVILKMASDHPSLALIGMDITFKRAVKVAEKSQSLGQRNLTSILCNAKALDSLFAPGELDGVFIFFPDPWAKKKRQVKHRLLNSAFLKILHQKIRPGGFFWLKTDCLPYFEQVCEAIEPKFWLSPAQRSGLPTETYLSRFERLFKDQGLPCFEACWTALELPLAPQPAPLS